MMRFASNDNVRQQSDGAPEIRTRCGQEIERSESFVYDADQHKAWRDKRNSDPAYRAKINRQANERARRIRDWLDAYKVEKGCTDCGYNDNPAALDFDHVNGDKRMNVCNAKSIAQAEREIPLCVVRCANCHRIKTVDRIRKDRPRPAHTSPERSDLCKGTARP
jgi:hypothetical protein